MADEVVKVIKIEAQGSETTVKQLRQEIASLRDALLNTEKGSDQYKQTVEKLTSTQNKLTEVMKAGKEVFVGSKQELKALKQQMDQLQQGTAEYNAAFQRAAEITHTLQERQELLKYSAADVGTQLQNVVSIGSSMAAGFNAMNAVMTLTGGKSEDLQKAMVKLQAGIALVQGLQGLEGMTKRMKGLVNGMTEMIFKTTETTAAVKAETAVVKANAAAQEANTVATAGATVATNAFKKALVATGIGAIVVLIGTLVANWDSLKSAIGLSNDKLERFGEILDTVRAAVVGVGNAILQILITPIKNAIAYVATLGKVLKDVFTLNFKDIGKDIKEGFDKIKENVKKGYDVVGNYQSAFNKRSAQLSEKRKQQAMKASAEELNETIKDNEAKYGSDWKYTEAGKKMYDEYFQKKLAGYKKDSKEYRDVQREMWSYEREFNDRKTKAVKDTAKTTKAIRDKEAEEAEKQKEKDLANIGTIQKRAEDAAKTELQLLKDKYEEEKALFEKYEKDTTALTAEYEKKKADIIKKEQEKAAADSKKKMEEATKNALFYSQKSLNTSEDTHKNTVNSIQLEYSFKEAKQSGALSYKDIIEQTNRIYEANKLHLEEQAAEYKKLMENEDIDPKARADAQRDYNNTMEELRNADTQNLIDNLNLQKEAIEAEIQMYSDLAVAIGDIFGSIADILENDIKAKIQNGKLTQEEGEKQFEFVKALQIAQATINTISGAIAAFMGCQELPQPAGAIIGAVQAAAVTAAGVAQIAKIASTQIGSTSTISSQMSANAAQPEPETYQPQMYQNLTGESEIVKLADSIKEQRVYVVESDITEAQNRSKVRVTESTW